MLSSTIAQDDTIIPQFNETFAQGSLDSLDEINGEKGSYALKQRVKYCRIIKTKIKAKYRFYVQLICEGKPFNKKQKQEKQKQGKVGLDLGPSTIAIVSEEKAELREFCSELKNKQRQTRILQRKLDRQRRANNPHNFNENGTIKKGKKKWVNSNKYKQTANTLAEIHRQLAAHRKRLHGQLANELISWGNTFLLEKICYKAWQKMFGKSVRILLIESN